ncbi:hypothetical protein HPB50_023415 [Hyalomma asiaticum]|uniref:Uncharacterized protein n=1 Tax=Hyalomma asiaticum TaxID=266040 RepID=A0ACB7S1Q1_HYAAI|nr:hypothetical protein HPB50_023415 [Hyalomma asiaticum]
MARGRGCGGGRGMHPVSCRDEGAPVEALAGGGDEADQRKIGSNLRSRPSRVVVGMKESALGRIRRLRSSVALFMCALPGSVSPPRIDVV